MKTIQFKNDSVYISAITDVVLAIATRDVVDPNTDEIIVRRCDAFYIDSYAYARIASLVTTRRNPGQPFCYVTFQHMSDLMDHTFTYPNGRMAMLSAIMDMIPGASPTNTTTVGQYNIKVRPATLSDTHDPAITEFRDGQGNRWRKASKVKTFKTRPGDFELSLKYGMRTWERVDQTDLGRLFVEVPV